jgi:hypothetical protein
MKALLEIIDRIDEFDDEDVIFVRPDWGPRSDAEVFRLTEELKVPERPKELGLKYFLEVAIAREVLESFADQPTVTSLEKCRRVIKYAIDDA